MIRSLMVASAVVAMSVSAQAQDSSAVAGHSATAGGLQLAQFTAESQARKHLASQGYTSVSSLERDGDGRWTGTATKDGKLVIVAIKVPMVGENAH